LAKVLSNTYRLTGKQYGVNQQYPDAIELARKCLLSHYETKNKTRIKNKKKKKKARKIP
jgi:hypothetical protein